MRGIVRALAAFMLFVLAPGVVYAQATLAGIARDASGAVLPGVTVEAASPVLIEKVRTATTDETGRYTIPDLRPGDLHGHVHADWVQDHRPRGCRAQRHGRRHDQCRPRRRWRAGNDHGLGRDAGRRPAVDDATGGHGSGDRLGDSEFAHTVHRRRAHSGRAQRRVHGPGRGWLGRPGSRIARGQRRSNLRPAHDGQRRGAQLGDRRRMGRWRGSERDRARRSSPSTSRAWTRRPRPAACASTSSRATAATASAAPIVASYANQDLASDNFTGSDVQQRGLAVPGTIKANGDFNPGFGGPIMRDKLWFFLSGRSLFADNYVAGTFFNQNANKLDRFDYVPSTDQAILHQEQTIYQARLTWQAIAEAQVRDDLRPGELLRLHDRHRPGPGGAVTSPEAGNDRRFPLQRFVTVDWSTPVSNKLLIEASGIHRVERWGGMEPQVGKLGNIDHLEPGMISVTDTLNPVTGAPLTYRAATDLQQLLELEHPLPGSGVLHHRLPHASRSGFNNAFLHHENTTYSSPATPYSYDFTSMVPHVDHATASCRARCRSTSIATWGSSRRTSGRPDGGRCRAPSGSDSFKNSFPAQAISGTFFGRNLNISVPRDRQPELERHHAAARRDLRRVRQREDGAEGDAQQVPRGPRHHGIRRRAGLGRAESDPRACRTRPHSARGLTPTATSFRTAI